MLTRINNGMKRVKQTNDNLVKFLQQEVLELKEKRDAETKVLTNELNEFKTHNNLDDYFSKYLNNDTRKNTLKLVEELMKVDDESN